MRLLTLGLVVTGALNAAPRFPFVLGAGLVAAWAAITLCVERHGAGAGALVCFKQLGGVRRKGVARLTWFDGELFLRLP
jgi:hypothetical protein